MTGETETEAIRHALELQSVILDADLGDRAARHGAFLDRFWASVPEGILGQPMSKEDFEDSLGVGPDGV